jgi:integrase/recombinase XerD
MQKHEVRRPWRSVEERLSFAGPRVPGFIAWLRENGYSAATIKELVRLLAVWTAWLSVEGFSEDDLLIGFEASKAASKDETRTGVRIIGRAAIGAAALFIRYLGDEAVLSFPAPVPSPIERWPIVGAFRVWMREHRGLAETTQDWYQRNVVALIQALGDDPRAFTAEAVRGFVMARARLHSPGHARSITVPSRAYLRFLVATGRCAPGREHAIPAFTHWRLSAVPKFLADDDIERVIHACDGEHRLRDRAVVLLLARLGLRASDVANLKLVDIDWHGARVRLSGKARRQEWLPLTQEVGDAILAYLQRGRPPLPSSALFTTEIAPLRPITRGTVKCLVNRSLGRAHIQTPCKGAHVLRHSAATAMLRHGVSLAGVSAVLRHRSPATTALYAKVDFRLLSEIVQPWPGRQPC